MYIDADESKFEWVADITYRSAMRDDLKCHWCAVITRPIDERLLEMLDNCVYMFKLFGRFDFVA